ncbi:DUF4232 domain-containing protein [Actinokineospora enzanensis]|uniref:DUF4232 domain-containing protein n=1 Tax=Actinokineospora enzanensis TaxID=155975 RepID=UPI000A00D1AF|nr:DUF4232 domain-containing protein [Actinokineospora enzanensis]
MRWVTDKRVIGGRARRAAALVGGLVLVTALGGCGDRGQAVQTGQSAAPGASTTASEPTAAPTSSGPAPSAPDQPSQEPETSAAEDCKSGELKLSIRDGDAAAGTVYRKLVFTNTGTRTCVIQGFPGVSYVAGDDGHQVGPAAYRVGTKGAPVSLAPGVSASTDVGFVNVQNYDPAQCEPTAVRGLRVYPPHDTASLFLDLPGTGCATSPPGNQLTVKTVV